MRIAFDNYELLCRLWSPLVGAEEGGGCRPLSPVALKELKKLNLPTLAYRRARGDMIEVYRIVTDICDPKTTNNLFKIRGKNNMLLRGHQFTMEHERLYTSNRSNFFVNRIVNNWNSLPREVVGAGSLNAFKNLLDSLWSNQDLLYNDYRAVIEKKDYVLTGSKE